MTLRDGKTGMKFKIAEIGDSALKERLMTMGLIPGTKVQILRSAPLGDRRKSRLSRSAKEQER